MITVRDCSDHTFRTILSKSVETISTTFVHILIRKGGKLINSVFCILSRKKKARHMLQAPSRPPHRQLFSHRQTCLARTLCTVLLWSLSLYTLFGDILINLHMSRLILRARPLTDTDLMVQGKNYQYEGKEGENIIVLCASARADRLLNPNV